MLREIELAAGAFKVQFQYLDVLDSKDIETAFQTAAKGRADAILVMNSPVFIAHRKQVADLAVKNRLRRYITRQNLWKTGGSCATA